MVNLDLKTFILLTETSANFVKAYFDYISFCSKTASAFTNSYAAMVDIYLQERASTNSIELERKVMAKARDVFDDKFREQDFLRSVSEVTEAFSRMAKTTGFGHVYQNISNMAAAWNNLLIEPLRDKIFRTPSHKVHTEGSFSLFHYEDRMMAVDKSETQSAPLLVVYAFINRHYILDLLPQISVIRNLMQQGLDIYASDWGTPGAYDKELSIGHYVNNYLDSSIDNIIKHANTDKVSLLGYCWGGDLALMYASIHPEKVKNVVTFATPGDFALDNGLLALWTRNTNADAIVDAFGNAPSMLLNSAFALRSPIDYLHKYPHFFEKMRDLQSIMEFFATEMWLYDSPPVIGEIYRQFVNDCYKKNLLIQNKMTIGNNTRVDLRKVKTPYLNIVATNDDLVEPESSKALNKAVGTFDSRLIEFKSGHVGACISANAHKDLWPRVGQWLKEHA
ncbi:MAG: alpha/beta fold hydrolase [Clostridia bacterium]